MVDTFRVAVLLAATVAMGLMAGLFTAFSYAVMPGLGRTDDRTMVNAMRSINAAILNGWFLSLFLGALPVTGIAAALQLGRPPFFWVVAALVLYLVALVITSAVNVPLNNALASAIGDLTTARDRFEAKWVRWNQVRGIACVAGFGCLAWALVLHGAASG